MNNFFEALPWSYNFSYFFLLGTRDFFSLTYLTQNKKTEKSPL